MRLFLTPISVKEQIERSSWQLARGQRGDNMDKREIYEIINKAYFSDEPDEREVLENLPKCLRSVRTFVDIGASLGQYTYYANKYIQAGHIIAIEPDPIRFPELERNCHNWQPLSNNKIDALHAAISDKDGEITFYTTSSTVSGGLFKHDISGLPEEYRNAVRWEEVSVDCFRLDTLFKTMFKGSDPDFVKIDVEGSELRVLRGCTEILRQRHAIFLVELHNWRDPEGQRSSEEVLEFMKSFGYYPFDYHGHKLFVEKSAFFKVFVKVPHLWFIGKLRSSVRSVKTFLVG